MPGLERFQPANATEMLATISSLRDDIEEIRRKVASGEVDQKDALDRVLQGLLELADAAEPVLKDYRKPPRRMSSFGTIGSASAGALARTPRRAELACAVSRGERRTAARHRRCRSSARSARPGSRSTRSPARCARAPSFRRSAGLQTYCTLASLRASALGSTSLAEPLRWRRRTLQPALGRRRSS